MIKDNSSDPDQRRENPSPGRFFALWEMGRPRCCLRETPCVLQDSPRSALRRHDRALCGRRKTPGRWGSGSRRRAAARGWQRTANFWSGVEIDGINGGGTRARQIEPLIQMKALSGRSSGGFCPGPHAAQQRDGGPFEIHVAGGFAVGKEGSPASAPRSRIRAQRLAGAPRSVLAARGELARELRHGRKHSAQPPALEFLSSFSLGGITPFAADDAPGRLRLHRFRGVWSMEGRLETRAFEEIQLSCSWSGSAVRCERFGAVGSLPVNGFFPFVAVEDTAAGVVWGAQVAHPWLVADGGLSPRRLGFHFRRPGGSRIRTLAENDPARRQLHLALGDPGLRGGRS